ncbi:hypothetical protein SH1V18_15270 [Vallitalea longa]|uniref:Uncharacterized protein n=1 Tax=Vallitalea longa TaxID=2936439 RepID=A0A9W5Y8D3_9FIRM|nr:hypothetical protein [Vallitalea longa]GKX29047.1 hypothetical protein SH1V18_15270 [Vallitalea longa]
MIKRERTCANCANNTKDGCIAMSERIGTNCFAWADNRERIKRIDDMINYSGGYLVSQNNRRLLSQRRKLVQVIEENERSKSG